MARWWWLGWMRPGWVMVLWVVGSACWATLPPPTQVQSHVQSHAQMLVSGSTTPPLDTAPWQATRLPHSWPPSGEPAQPSPIWYRLTYELGEGTVRAQDLAVYVPYLYTGGELYFNGQSLGGLHPSNAEVMVRWERPQLWVVPSTLVRRGTNVVLVKAWPSLTGRPLRMPMVELGDKATLEERQKARLFWVQTLPQVTVITCVLMAVFVMAIWWMRREEILYGLLGLGLLLWGLRTLPLVIEVMPVGQWLAWRCTYHAATGGFITVMALFALRFAQVHRPWLERAMIAYWCLGPVWMWVVGTGGEAQVTHYWTAGLLPVGLLIVAMECHAYWRQRSWQALALIVASGLAVVAGAHDYLVATDSPWMTANFPAWSAQRLYMLHHGANLLLLTTAGIMAARFIDTLDKLHELNQTLEHRVRDKETELAQAYVERAALERARATEEERQRIVLDMHDGLGSRLFTSLTKVQRGGLSQQEVADVLKSCIGDMRLVLDAMAPSDDALPDALANFRYRWEAQLKDAGLASSWVIDPRLSQQDLSAHQRLQVLHILQEALTNVLRHARAQQVWCHCALEVEGLSFEVRDDGQGLSDGSRHGRGLNHMALRARRIGGHLQLDSSPQGTCLRLSVPTHPRTNQAIAA